MAWMELRERENVPDPRGRAAASTTFLRWRRPRGQEAADLDQGAPHEGVMIASARSIHRLSCGAVGECTGQWCMHHGKGRACC